MEIRRRCNNSEIYFEIVGANTPYFKNVRRLKNNLIVCEASKNGTEWVDNIAIGCAFLIIKNPFSIISDGRIVTQNDQGNWCVQDSKGNMIVPYGKYSLINGFSCRLARVKKHNTAIFFPEGNEEYYDTWGVIDVNGREIIECVYDEIYNFYGNNNWFTILKRGSKSTKFHLCYRKPFGNTSDVEWMQYLEDKGSITNWCNNYSSQDYIEEKRKLWDFKAPEIKDEEEWVDY
jgi:hypothetical protein